MVKRLKRPSDQATGNDKSSSAEQNVALALEFASRCSNAGSYDETCFYLTNDLRVLAGFDRCFLITHFGSKSRLVSATNQPTLDGKSRLQEELGRLAENLIRIDRPIVTAANDNTTDTNNSGNDQAAAEALQAYIQISGANMICCVPLTFQGVGVAHLVMEYLEGNTPPKTALMAIVKIAPALGASLFGQWSIEKKPGLYGQLPVREHEGSFPRAARRTKGLIIGALAILLAIVLFAIPVTRVVGGESVIAARERNFAFCKIGGLIKEVYVSRGEKVEEGQALAILDSRDLDHSIAKEKRHYQILSKEMELLKSRSFDDPSRLARSELLQLKRKNVEEELEYLLWQRDFMEIRSPCPGLVITKDVDTLAGKKLEPGAVFCEIAEAGNLEAEVYVPEERIMGVRKGQDLFIYLNNAPGKSYRIEVDEIAVRSQVRNRLGNVYEVSGDFPSEDNSVRVGMKGIGKIHVGRSNIWSILSSRLVARWNQISVYFL
jgi:hypothetical protein